MASDERAPGVSGETAQRAHDLMTALAIARGNAQLLRRRAGREASSGATGPTGAIGDLDADRLREGLHRIEAALTAAIDAGAALIRHAEEIDARDGTARG